MKHREILDALLTGVSNRDGQERIEELRLECKPYVNAGVHRELILQIIRREKPHRRWLFLVLYPELIIPYLCRIRKP
mgnify:CR=1 FL=1